ncbi:cytochrome P450 [Infundibulicybe gibba]|nr:cytochrome P450 [Infundibulicybe gibba]
MISLDLLASAASFSLILYLYSKRPKNSDIIHLEVAGTSIVVLDTSEATTELFERKSSLYSSRARMPMINELMGWDFNFGFMEYARRQHRRIMHQAFHPTAALQFRPHEIKRGVHPLVAAAVPGAFLVDTFPFLKYVPEWMPGAGFQKKAKEWGKLSKAMVEVPFRAAMKNIANGEATPSFVSYSMQRIDESSDVEYQKGIVQTAAGTLYAASCILAEIDSVVGRGHLPDFEDEDSLPFVTAIVKETLRWRDVVPIAIPHLLEVEDVYKGYRIPAGTVCIPNAWAMLHDEKVYPDPFSFKPERFMKDGKLDPNVRDPAHAAFGFGRRVCPGRYMAYSAVWIAIASILATFDIEKVTDENGNIIEPSHEYLSALVCMPLPFKCAIKPRSKEAADLIRATANMGD